MNVGPPETKRIAIFSMFGLADQYDLAAEFKDMLEQLSQHASVLHLSCKSPRQQPGAPAGVTVDTLLLKIDRTSRKDMNSKAILAYLYIPMVASRLRKFRPHVVFLPDVIPLYGFFLSLLCRTRVVLSYGDWHFHNVLGRKWWAKPFIGLAYCLNRLEVRTVYGFTSRADSVRVLLQNWNIPSDRIRIFHDAPDPAAFYPRDSSSVREQCGFTPRDVVLLFHGVLHQGKGIDLLVKWTAELHSENPHIALMVVGDGPELGILKQLAERLGIPRRVRFTGWLETTKDVGAHCNAADICVAMRTHTKANRHIIPGALLHSMACGKIVLAPRMPGMMEIIEDGVSGFLFDADDGASFKQVIREIVSRKDSWPRIERQAHEFIRNNFSIEQTALKYADALLYFAKL